MVDAEHYPVEAQQRYDEHGCRTFEPVADVCAACTDWDTGLLVPVSFCPLALAAYDAERAWLHHETDEPPAHVLPGPDAMRWVP